jgi:hypothetical protein
MAKDPRKDLMGIVVLHALEEARAGHLAPLIGRVRSGVPLTPEERQFIAAALEQLEGKHGKDERRRLKKKLVQWRVEELLGQDVKLESVVKQIKEERGYGRTSVFNVLKESKKGK